MAHRHNVDIDTVLNGANPEWNGQNVSDTKTKTTHDWKGDDDDPSRSATCADGDGERDV